MAFELTKTKQNLEQLARSGGNVSIDVKTVFSLISELESKFNEIIKSITVDSITEYTLDNGINIEGVLVKDSNVTGNVIGTIKMTPVKSSSVDINTLFLDVDTTLLSFKDGSGVKIVAFA